MLIYEAIVCYVFLTEHTATGTCALKFHNARASHLIGTSTTQESLHTLPFSLTFHGHTQVLRFPWSFVLWFIELQCCLVCCPSCTFPSPWELRYGGKVLYNLCSKVHQVNSRNDSDGIVRGKWLQTVLCLNCIHKSVKSLDGVASTLSVTMTTGQFESVRKFARVSCTAYVLIVCSSKCLVC